jgi:hypothetical protein
VEQVGPVVTHKRTDVEDPRFILPRERLGLIADASAVDTISSTERSTGLPRNPFLRFYRFWPA